MRVVRSSDRATIFSMLPDATLPLHFAQVVATAQVTASQLFVGFSDDGRVVVPVLALFVVFIFVIIIIGISRRYRGAAHDGDEAPNVVRNAWSHDRLLRRRATFMTMLARAFAPGKASTLLSFTRTACNRALIGGPRDTTVGKPDWPILPMPLA